MTLRRTAWCIAFLVVAAAPAHGEDGQKGPDKQLSGMSIIGNDEAPKSLVIVPWKSSEMGDTLDVSRMLGDGRQPVDREVFARELDYYRIRTASRRAAAADTQ